VITTPKRGKRRLYRALELIRCDLCGRLALSDATHHGKVAILCAGLPAAHPMDIPRVPAYATVI
jgi:hypothetical protein